MLNSDCFKPADDYYTNNLSGESFSWNGADYTTTQAGTRIAKTDVLLIKYELDCYS
jgi:hypothetical protein